MKMSLTALRVVVDSNVRGFIEAIACNNSRQTLNAATLDAFVDNSTGVVGSSLTPVPTQTSRVAQSGANLASRTGFNTAIGSVNNAVAVLRDVLLRNGFTPLQFVPAISGGDGTVAVQGTVAAITKTVTGVDGSAGDAMTRQEMNAAIIRARNNLAVVLRAYNMLATTLGLSTIKNTTGGQAPQALALSAGTTAPTGVLAASVAAGDLATKAAADAALTALANDIATLFDKIRNTTLNKAATLSQRIPTILTR